MKRWIAWIRYSLNRSLVRGSILQYGMLAVGAAGLVVAGSQAIHMGLFSSSSLKAEGIEAWFGGGAFDSFWWSLKHVLDPGAFSEDYGAPWPVLGLAFVISVGGVFIMGALIGLISASIQQRFNRLQRGNSAVIESDHVLILGWSPGVPGLVSNLASIHPGRTIVILAPRDLELMAEGLRNGGVDPRRISTVLRTGLPSRRADLDRVAVSEAAAVVVVSYAREENQESGESDVEAIKTLLLLMSFVGASGDGETNPGKKNWRINRHNTRQAPVIVCEITQKQNIEIAKIASGGKVSLVSSADFVSRLLVQASRQPGVASVFDSILNVSGGSISVRDDLNVLDRSIDEVIHSIRGAVPIGLTWTESTGESERAAVALNPEPSYELAEGERLVLLGEEAGVSLAPLSTQYDGERLRDAARSPAQYPDLPLNSVLILGWSSMLDDILFELDGHTLGVASITVVSGLPMEEAQRALSGLKFSHLEIDHQRGDTVNRATLASLEIGKFDCIFALADDTDGEDPDARTILTLLLLGDIAGSSPGPETPRVVAELQDWRNRELLEDSIAQDIVVSPDLVSIVMAQISRLPVLGPVYRELLGAGGIEVAVRPASRYAELGQPTPHTELIATGHKAFEIILGVRLNSSGQERVILAPDPERIWTFAEGDSVIALSQQVYR
jgi:hypothetical protein